MAVVGPHQRHTVGNFEIALAHQRHGLVPGVHQEFRILALGAHDFHLRRDRALNRRRAALLGFVGLRIVFPERAIVAAAIAERPDHFLLGQIAAQAGPPRVLEQIGTAQERIRHVLRPAVRIQAHHFDVVLRDDEPALARRAYLRLIGEQKRARRDHVAFHAQQRLEDLVPQFQRESRFRVRLPTGEQIFVVNEPPAITKPRPFLNGDRRDVYHVSARRLTIGPVVKRIDAQEAPRELVDRVDRAAQIRTRQHDSTGRGADREHLGALRAQAVAGRAIEADDDGGALRRRTQRLHRRSENLAHVRRQVGGGAAQSGGLIGIDDNRTARVDADVGGRCDCRKKNQGACQETCLHGTTNLHG